MYTTPWTVNGWNRQFLDSWNQLYQSIIKKYWLHYTQGNPGMIMLKAISVWLLKIYSRARPSWTFFSDLCSTHSQLTFASLDSVQLCKNFPVQQNVTGNFRVMFRPTGFFWIRNFFLKQKGPVSAGFSFND